MILVTTAGKVGTAAVQALRAQDEPVRVVVRAAGRGAALAALGAEVVVVDLDDPAGLERAMAGVAAVVLVSPGLPAQERNVVAAAVRAGVGHVVKVTSNSSPDSPIARRRWASEIEADLIASGLPHTLLRANAFMQNQLALAPAIAATGGFGSVAGTGRMGMVDARDVAEVAAAIARAPEAHRGRTYRLTGPASISNDDVARVLSDVLGRTVTFRSITFQQNVDAMLGAGVPEGVAVMNAQAFRLIAEGDADWVSEDVATLLGRPARSFAQFARDHAAAFS